MSSPSVYRNDQEAELAFEQASKLLRMREIISALIRFDEAQQAGYSQTECCAARWNCWMLLGEFEKAWSESDAIAKLGLPDPNRFWTGESWTGKRVMLRCLHGLGDTIQFIRYAADLRMTCESLIVQTHPQLASLLEGVSGIDRVVTWGMGQPECTDWNMQMEVTELPRAFRTTRETVPSTTPYIQVEAEHLDWARKIIGPERSFKVGVTWESSSWDTSRSIDLQDLDPLLQSSECRFFAIQKGAEPEQFAKDGRMVDLQGFIEEVRDTAAFLMSMDLVISVDTMTAHLAGALGRPVWILLPAAADWRWMMNRADSPWYPTARLFRQHDPGRWNSVINEVSAALDRLMSIRSSSA